MLRNREGSICKEKELSHTEPHAPQKREAFRREDSAKPNPKGAQASARHGDASRAERSSFRTQSQSAEVATREIGKIRQLVSRN